MPVWRREGALVSNSISVSHLDIEARRGVAELLREPTHFIVNPENAPLTVTINGAEAWVEYRKMQVVDTKELLGALSRSDD